MPSVKLYHGDNLDIFPLLEDESVDTIITDPPYGLEFMGKKWDKPWVTGTAEYGMKDTHSRKAGPVYGSKRNPVCLKCHKHKRGRNRCQCDEPEFDETAQMWAQRLQSWHYAWAKEALRVAKPGAMLCAFGGTRTHHRLMCAIEDAGWEIRDVLMWLYGSGFPKSHDVSKAIDKAAGAEREVVGHYQHPDGRPRPDSHRSNGTTYGKHKGPLETPYTSPATDAAALWDGYGTALKPAYEPIILAMKPLPGTFAQNALGYGVAGLWVDGCRVGTDEETGRKNNKGPYTSERTWNVSSTGPQDSTGHGKGRWPANLLLSHAPGCECVGFRKVGNGNGGPARHNENSGTVAKGKQYEHVTHNYGTETVEAWNCVPECPVLLLDQSSGERRNGGQNATSIKGDGMFMAGDKERGTTNYAGDIGGASRFFTRFHYSAKASRAERELGLLGHIPCLKCGLLDSVTHMNPKTGKEEKCRRNGHPTVKPLDVCRWLCRLTKTPTGGVVLDPFAGSGRIPMAAILEGRDTIGIELERPSFEIAQAAVQWAQEQVPEMVQGELEHA